MLFVIGDKNLMKVLANACVEAQWDILNIICIEFI